MLDNRTVGRTIAALRQANGMTQQKLAATMNVSHQAVSKWETGQALPDMQTMFDLSRLFGVTMEQLLTGEIPEVRLHPREEGKEEAAGESAPAFDLRSAVQGVVSGIGSLFRGPAEPQKPEPAEEAPEATAAAPEPQESTPDTEDEAPAEAPADADAAESAADTGGEAEAKPQDDATPIDIEKIIEMAPFMSRVALEDMLRQYRGKFTARDVARLAPFVTSEALEALIWRVDGSLDWDLLRRIAPFLRRDVVDRLTYAYVQGEKAVRPAVENVGRAAEQLGRNIQRKVSGVDFDKLSEQIFNGVNQAVRSAQRFGESVAHGVERAFAPQDGKPAQKPRPEQPESVREARRHMFERAMAEEKWDWIAARLDGLDERLRADIAARAAEAGRLDWVAEYFEDYVSADTVKLALEGRNWDWLSAHIAQIDADLQAEIARTAAAERAWDFLAKNVDLLELDGSAKDIALAAVAADAGELLGALAAEHLTEEEVQEVAEKAIETGHANLLDTLVAHLGAGAVDQICLQLAESEGWEALEQTIEHADAAVVDAVCLRLAERGEWKRLGGFAGKASADGIARLMELAVAAGDWNAIEMLEGYMD